ncbi:hypothetical protein ABMA27_004130 [Loxostege sticticalis]|uniref:Lipase n=1 Tax=Loxostege sticticalis TaxID=481309 RepID=A0ABR3HMH1_LOXSC
MKKGLIFLAVILHVTVYSQLLKQQPEKLSEDGRLKFPELADKYGFPAQEESITTDDGYILTLYHIPGDTSKPVLLIHGNTPTIDCWIIRGNSSLAITLAHRGYDVWVIAIRGTRYSRKHVSLDPDLQPDQFFDYTFYEEGIYDVAATIDFILQKTGQEQLTAIGHSVGTTLLYVLGAEKPEYNDKIKLAVSLAPICFLQNLRGLTRLGGLLGPGLIDLLTLLNIQEVLSYDQITPVFQAICLNEPLGYELCIKIGLSAVLGADPKGIEPEFQKTLFGHFPGGSTRKLFSHLVQVLTRKKFAKYDYGSIKNLAVYGSFEPPEFDLKKVTMKSALFVGKEDFLSPPADAELLKAALPNVVHYQVLPYEKFNHPDFIWGRYMPDNFYPYLMEVLDKYE